jgi:hypothetical protein
MHQGLHLALHGIDHPRVAASHRVDRHTGGDIDVDIPIRILDGGALALRENQRELAAAAGHGLIGDRIVQVLLGLGTRYAGLDVGGIAVRKRCQLFFIDHGALLCSKLFVNRIQLRIRHIEHAGAGQFFGPEECRKPVIVRAQSGGLVETPLRLQNRIAQPHQIIL